MTAVRTASRPVNVARVAMVTTLWCVMAALVQGTSADADPGTAYRAAVTLAAEGHDGEAIARLRGQDRT